MSIKGGIAEATATTGNLIATTTALHWQAGVEDKWVELKWHEIARATWNSESARFVVIPVAGEPLEWTITDPGRLPEAARERITSTIVAQDQISLPGRGMVTLIFRQVDGQILVQTMPAVDPSLISKEIARVKADLGLG